MDAAYCIYFVIGEEPTGTTYRVGEEATESTSGIGEEAIGTTSRSFGSSDGLLWILITIPVVFICLVGVCFYLKKR